MKAKRLGRPKLAKGQAKGVLVGARFSPEEAKRVEAAAERSGQVKSDWIRNTLLQAAG